MGNVCPKKKGYEPLASNLRVQELEEENTRLRSEIARLMDEAAVKTKVRSVLRELKNRERERERTCRSRDPPSIIPRPSPPSRTPAAARVLP